MVVFPLQARSDRAAGPTGLGSLFFRQITFDDNDVMSGFLEGTAASGGSSFSLISSTIEDIRKMGSN